MFQLLTADEIIKVFKLFQKQNPNPKSELKWKNAYTLLVSVVLSAQATDKSVNKATEPLYKIVDNPKNMIRLGEKNLMTYIRSIGLYRAKAKYIIGLSERLITVYNGKVPDNQQDLMTLPGVGRKTANVVLNVVFGQKTMPVDTHLKRICPKIGLCNKGTVDQIEKSLVQRIPAEFMDHAHHWLILHGRYTCIARKPKCEECIIKGICKHNT